MSLPDETLRKILLQIQQNALVSQKNLQSTSQQLSAKERERRIVQITTNEVNAMGDGAKVYKGVGKMFMLVPRKDMADSLKAQEKELSDDMTSLAKKAKFLEKQLSEAQGQLKDIFHSRSQS